MRPSKKEPDGSDDLFRARLDQIINMKHDLARITVDTTVQPKNVAHPTDATLMLTAIRKLGKQAKADGGALCPRQAVQACGPGLKFLCARLGRLVRDIHRKTADDEALEAAFAVPLSKAMQIRGQRQNRRGWMLYSWHAPEIECIGKGKAHKPYEFGC